MKNNTAIIGAIINYNDFDMIKSWVHSIRHTGFTGEVVIVAINVNDDMCKVLKNNNIKVYHVVDGSNFHPWVMRFSHIYNYLENNNHKNVIITDVRDAVFQKDPSEYVDSTLKNKNKEIIASSENILLQNEPWNRNNVISTFGIDEYEKIKDIEALCDGVIAGTHKAVKNLCLEMYIECIDRQTNDQIPDQASLNVILRSDKWKDKVEIPSLDEAWSYNAGVVYSNSVNSDHLLSTPAHMENGLVKNSLGDTFYIAHQYDRSPEWTKIILNKYDK